GLVQRLNRWYAMSIQPLADEAGKVYGGMSIRVDVHDQVSNVLQLVANAQVAGFGSFGLLREGASGQPELVAHGEQANMELDSAAAATLLAGQFDGPEGIAEITAPDGQVYLESCRKIENWDWTQYGIGKNADFMAQSVQALIVQSVMVVVGTLVISLVAGWLGARTL